MTNMSWELQDKITNITNEACYLLGIHIESRFREIVVELENGDEYIAEIADIIFPRTNRRSRNVSIQNYFTEKMQVLDMGFVKLEKTCFDNQIYYHLCYEEISEE